jgi:hypothetical protein
VSYLICILFFCFFTWGVIRWKFFNLQGISRKLIVFAFILKLLAGVGLTLYYNQNMERSESDTFRYFDDSEHLHKAITENPKVYLKMLFVSDDSQELMPYLNGMNNWFPAQRTALYNDNRTVIRLNAMMRIVSFGNYYTHLLFFSMMAFYGLTFIYKAFHKNFVGKKKILFAIIFLTPSLMFWSSGILKEAPLLLAFGILLNILNKIFNKKVYWLHYLILIFCTIFLFHLKFYVGLLLVPAITGYLWIINQKGPHPIIKVILNFSIYFSASVIWHYQNWNWSLFTVLKWKRKDFLGLAKIENAKSLIETGNLEDNPLSFLMNAPMGLWNSISRPYLWEVYSLAVLPNAIENIFIFLFIIICVVFGKRTNFKNIGYFFIMYALGLMTIIGMVTPIIGSLVRYKIPALPFFLMFFLLFLDMDKLKSRFFLLNKIL